MQLISDFLFILNLFEGGDNDAMLIGCQGHMSQQQQELPGESVCRHRENGTAQEIVFSFFKNLLLDGVNKLSQFGQGLLQYFQNLFFDALEKVNELKEDLLRYFQSLFYEGLNWLSKLGEDLFHYCQRVYNDILISLDKFRKGN
ncbi:unnamed protein product [Ranitomeya imitator]|uniref:Uncharacterized protein n=1 Tax=Ranitomeya imitator TaxID=111125 RepID=A0ABN9LNY2_9NEOB|nr:unnamed protein product [Ranitomeya imitator]